MSVQSLFSLKVWVRAVAGATGNVFAMGAFYPLETIRFRMQLGNLDKYADKSTFEILKKLVETEGFFTLYRGMTPVLVSLSTSSFVYFYSFHGLKIISKEKASHDLVLGLVAGVINVFLTTPLWVVNSRIKMKGVSCAAAPFRGLLDGLLYVAQHEGVARLWAGVVPSLLLVSNPAIQFMVYESLKRHLLRSWGELSTLGYFTIGAVAKAVSTFVTYPLQVVQTQLRHGGSSDPDLPPDIGVFEFLVYILKRRGVRGLYRGLEAKLLQTVLTAALAFATYEKIAHFVISLLLPKKRLAAS